MSVKPEDELDTGKLVKIYPNLPKWLRNWRPNNLRRAKGKVLDSDVQTAR